MEAVLPVVQRFQAPRERIDQYLTQCRGDFKFDNLPENTYSKNLEICHDGYVLESRPVAVIKKGVNLETIHLTPN